MFTARGWLSSRRTVIVASGLAAVAIIAVAILVVTSRRSGDGQASPSLSADGSEAARATPTGSPTPEPRIGTTDLKWQQVADFGEPGAWEEVNDVAIAHGTFVAVGTHFTSQYGQSTLPPHEGRVWLSTDGSSWEPVQASQTFADAILNDVFVTADGAIVAWGQIGDFVNGDAPNAAWETTDGRAWRRTASGLPQVAWIHETDGAQGYVANTGRQGEIWFSADGRAWERVWTTNVPTAVTDIGAGDEGFVATTAVTTGPYVGEGYQALASSDGLHWIPLSKGEPIGKGRYVAPIGADWFAASRDGQVRHSSNGFSADGFSWDLVGQVPLEEAQIDAGTLCPEFVERMNAPGGLLIASTVLYGDCMDRLTVTYGQQLISLDGITWEALPFAAQDIGQSSAKRGSFVASGISLERRLLLVGQSNGRAAFWLGVP